MRDHVVMGSKHGGLNRPIGPITANSAASSLSFSTANTLPDEVGAAEVVHGVNILRCSSHWESIGSSGPPTDSKSESTNMTTVIYRKQVRVLKHKQTSPGIIESVAKQARDVTYSGTL